MGNSNLDWKITQGRLEAATAFAEELARACGFTEGPVDPLHIVESEAKSLTAIGDDFGDAFDGRLEYVAPKFLLLFNTKYNSWSHVGQHHPKVKFTIAHELGHYFLEHHRNYLRAGKGPHSSKTDFETDNLAEREADCFAAGLLMPRKVLEAIVNKRLPTLSSIRSAAGDLQVSLTSMLVRWIQLCDFPCAVASIRAGRIQWGFVSEGFRRNGVYRIHRDVTIQSSSALAFFQAETTLSTFREAENWGQVQQWFENVDWQCDIRESYFVVPAARQVLALLTVSEEDLEEARPRYPNEESD